MRVTEAVVVAVAVALDVAGREGKWQNTGVEISRGTETHVLPAPGRTVQRGGRSLTVQKTLQTLVQF